MKKLFLLLSLIPFVFGCQEKDANNKWNEKHQPSDAQFIKHAWPDLTVDLKNYYAAVEQAKQKIAEKGDTPGFADEWTVRGPANIGARINTIAFSPPSTFYLGFARGGVYKATDFSGTSWTPIFDDNNSLSIGDIEISPSDPDVVYVGTGDPNISGLPAVGDGIYKSTDGGDSWTNIGLSETRITSKILIHPDNEDIVFAATMGLPFERNEDRGLYRTTNGGDTWEKILYVADDAGIIDLVMDPFDNNTLYASSWNRIRNNQESIVNGDDARIYKTTDGGDNWTMLEGGLPGFDEPIGRIGLAASPIDANTLYAMYVSTSNQLHNIYKTTDGGTSWTPLLDWENPDTQVLGNALGGFGWYFGQLRHHPTNAGELYLMGVNQWRTTDDAVTWQQSTPPWWTYEVHADHHDFVFMDEHFALAATDGGLYLKALTFDAPEEGWSRMDNIPNTQFYRVAYNPNEPTFCFGGAQDNGFTGGPNIETDWQRLHGGDGFQPIFVENDPNLVYSATQNGALRISLDGYAGPWDGFTQGIDGEDRTNWDTPFIMSPHDQTNLYTGTYRVYKMANAPFSEWMPISDDLTDGLIFSSNFHTISTIAESPIEQGVLYVGTTDANVWVTQNDGAEWTNITEGLPNRYITDIKGSPTEEGTVYVTISGYKDNDFTPHIYKSTDYGQTWENFASDLPQVAINDVYILPDQNDQIVFVGTDVGVYATNNGGESWERLGTNMPLIPVYDLDWNEEYNELIAGTFARSIQTYNLDTLSMGPVATEDVIINNTLALYPNPTSDEVKLKNKTAQQLQGVLTITNTTGQKILESYETLAPHNTLSIDVTHLQKGHYIAQWQIGDHKINKPFIVIR